MKLDTVELDQRCEAFWKPDVQTADRAEFVFVCPVYHPAVRRDRKSRPSLQVFAGGDIERSPTRSPNAVGAYADDHSRAISGFGYRYQSQKRVDLAHTRIVFETEVHAWMPSIDECRAHGGPIDLPFQQSKSESELLRVIGRPPDSLAFARSDRSGRHKRGLSDLLLF